MADIELDALTDFLNDIESVAQKHGWNIGMYDNLSENDSPSVEITFIPAISYDSQFRKFGKGATVWRGILMLTNL